MTSDNSRHRLGLLAVAALSLFGALFARLWFLQIVEGDTAEAEATANTTQVEIIPAPRGVIYDRNKTVLVDNRESIVVGIERQKFNELEKATQKRVLTRLAATLSAGRPVEEKVTVTSLRKKLNDGRYSKFRPIPVAEDISEEDEIYFSEQASQYPTVVVERSTVRVYPYGSLAAHVLGYVGALSDGQWKEFKETNDPKKPYVQTDEIGKAGVEAEFEKDLRGTPGRRVYKVDRTGKVVSEVMSKRVEPKAGDDLYLSIDAKVQYKTEEALQARLSLAFDGQAGKEAGAMVVMDQSTGQVRAMASYPTYNPSDLVGGISCPRWRDLQGLDPNGGDCLKDIKKDTKRLKAADDAPVSKLLNRAYQGAYQPASTFKLASAYAALKDGLRTTDSVTNDNGVINLCGGSEARGCVKQNAKKQPHGPVSLSPALTVSSDIYFYEIGRDFWAENTRNRLGETAFQDAVGDLGYGSQTGIDLPAETPGEMPTPDKEMELAMALFDRDPGAYDNDREIAKQAGRWNTGYSADMAIGQKLTATPLQTANAYAALANGGTLYHPSVFEKTTAAGRGDQIHRKYKPSVIRQINWGTNRDAFITGFESVVDPNRTNPYGTATKPFQGFPFDAMPLAGKTGTAQTGEYKNGLEKPDNSVFVAFTNGGPTSWVATAMLEYSGSGANAAAPAVRMVLEPIADKSIDQFEIPTGGAIDAEEAANQSGIIGGGAD
jgi:penicillin-binding protein 2